MDMGGGAEEEIRRVSPAPSAEAQPVANVEGGRPSFIRKSYYFQNKAKQKTPNQIYVSNVPILTLIPPFFLIP